MTNNVQENIFEERAKLILKYLKTDLRYGKTIPRPFFLELTGSPSSGKTTAITELDKFFRRQGFRVLRPQEGAEVIRHIERTTPLYNIRTGLYALELLLDIAHSHTYDVVIFDRCIFDSYVWMMYWLEKSKLDEKERALIQSFFLFRLFTPYIDTAYFMVCEPEEAMRRELRIALSNKLGETSNPDSIATLVARYKKAYEELSPKFPQLSIIDTTKLGEHEMIEMIADSTLRVLEEKSQRPV